MSDYKCPNCGQTVQDMTRKEELTEEQMAQYRSGDLGVYVCTSCGWIGDKEEIDEAQS
jgi:DNA-directed RNA polymerase subunit RPC12/RpoP